MNNALVLVAILMFTGNVLLAQEVDHWESAVLEDQQWSYYVGSEEPPASWRDLTFDDSSWSLGTGGIGYGDDDDNTTIEETGSLYLRRIFSVSDASKIARGVLHIDYDDAFVAYLNGTEIARSGISGSPPTYDALADAEREAQVYSGGTYASFIVDEEAVTSKLTDGDNILSVQVHNSSTTSSDMTARVFLSFGITDGSVLFESVPSWFSAPISLSESDIPLVVIETEAGAEIVDEPKVTADMRIIYTPGEINSADDMGNVYSGKIGIEIRGKYSASLPQKPFGLETRDELGENLNVEILGMPKENDWILLANYNDKTFLRNALAFKLFREMGHYAPRTTHAEVIVNDEYQGIYVFTERIKRDKNRVDVAKLKPEDIEGDEVTGGYIFKVDYFTEEDSWVSNYPPLGRQDEVRFVYHDPKADELVPQQKNYIEGYVNDFETTLYGSNFDNISTGYASYIDVNSFVDYFIMGELSRNVDAYKKSCYYHKDKASNGGLIKAGPIWDQDWAWKNLNECFFSATDGSGWAYDIYECNPWPTPPTWMYRLLEDGYFRSKIFHRYHQLREGILSETYINHYIDSTAAILEIAQGRHYQKWDILGRNVGAPEVDNQPDTYAGEISKFKNWIATRLAWMDANISEDWVGVDYLTSINDSHLQFSLFPNPSTNQVRFEFQNRASEMEIYSISGTKIMTQQVPQSNSIDLNISFMEKGLYLAVVLFENGTRQTVRFVKK